MTQAKHTPGPWIQMGTSIGVTYGEIASVWEIDGRSFANARLIAAAPDLLDSHEPEHEGADLLDWIADRLVNVYGESENVDFVICLRRRAAKARAAISKATVA